MLVIDTSELQDLAKDIERLTATEISIAYQKALRNIAGTFLGAVIPETPVDTGYLRQNWEAGGDVNISKSSVGYTAVITNPTEYASYVNYGHRTRDGGGWVPGYFFVESAAETTKLIAPGKLKTEIVKAIERSIG